LEIFETKKPLNRVELRERRYVRKQFIILTVKLILGKEKQHKHQHKMNAIIRIGLLINGLASALEAADDFIITDYEGINLVTFEGNGKMLPVRGEWRVSVHIDVDMIKRMEESYLTLILEAEKECAS
jgi:hypothetical protein